MTDPIMNSAAVMRAQINRLDVIAQNASNVNSPGYLQQSAQLSSENFLAMLNAQDSTRSPEITHNQELGTLAVTNRDLDVALASDHYFVLESLDNLITRNGRFSISDKGYLQLNQYRVMGEAGPIGQLNGKIKIHSDGSIYNNDQYVDKLKVVSIDNKKSLQSLGSSVYLVEASLMPATDAKVVQGALIASNVKLETDMTSMIEITRHIEMIQRSMSAYDDMLKTGITEIGK